MHINQEITLEITSLGGMGDGVGHADGVPVFVPFTAVGDKAKVAIESINKDYNYGKLLEVIEAGKGRATPPCVHFAKCGGCTMQHIGQGEYNTFKSDILLQAIKRLGGDAAIVDDLIEVGQKSRRRAEFKVSVNKGDVSIGFFAAKTHNVIDLAMCPVTNDALTALLPELKSTISALKKPGNIKAVNITLADNGVDIIVAAAGAIIAADKNKLVEFAENNNVLRLCEQVGTAEIDSIYMRENPQVNFGGFAIELPMGSFLQATKIGQMAITKYIIEHTKNHKRVADLYCGSGTYSFPMVADGHIVSAYEGSEEMVLTIHNTARRNNIEKNITAHKRDLFKRPLKVHELKNFDALVINPPRNGALTQVEEIAKSTINKVVMVSCNPATFERDAKCLINSGYKITKAVPIDQFYWNSHLEVVVVFER